MAKQKGEQRELYLSAHVYIIACKLRPLLRSQAHAPRSFSKILLSPHVFLLPPKNIFLLAFNAFHCWLASRLFPRLLDAYFCCCKCLAACHRRCPYPILFAGLFRQVVVLEGVSLHFIGSSPPLTNFMSKKKHYFCVWSSHALVIFNIFFSRKNKQLMK